MKTQRLDLILSLSIPRKRNTFVAERYLSDLINIHGKHPVSTDGVTWYPMACRFFWVRTSYSFFSKDPDRKKNAYIKGQNRKF